MFMLDQFEKVVDSINKAEELYGMTNKYAIEGLLEDNLKFYHIPQQGCFIDGIKPHVEIKKNFNILAARLFYQQDWWSDTKFEILEVYILPNGDCRNMKFVARKVKNHSGLWIWRRYYYSDPQWFHLMWTMALDVHSSRTSPGQIPEPQDELEVLSKLSGLTVL